MPSEDRSRDIAAVAALADPVRRALYEHVVAQPDAIGRDQAAAAVGIGRPLAAFHLDRLVRDGLLEAGYRRLGGRTGPGAGRPSKVYRPASAEFHVSLPQREYELAARLLVKAMAGSRAREPRAALERAAREIGTSLARSSRAASTHGPTRQPLREDVLAALATHGFQPSVDADGVVRLLSCPFHSLAQAEPDLICSMNLALVQGLTDGLGEAGVEAVRDARPGICCVALRPTGRRRSGRGGAG